MSGGFGDLAIWGFNDMSIVALEISIFRDLCKLHMGIWEYGDLGSFQFGHFIILAFVDFWDLWIWGLVDEAILAFE